MSVDADPAKAHLRDLLTDGDIAVDVGANPRPTAAVSFVELLSDCVGEAGLVIAFDPFPFDAMYDIADARANVVFVRAAVAHEPLALVETRDTAGNWVSSLQRTYTGHVPLDIVTEAAAVKVDVEGYEWHVLQSADRLLETVRPAWLIEVHPHKPKADGAVQYVLDRLYDADYAVFTAADSQPIESADDLDPDGATDVLALP